MLKVMLDSGAYSAWKASRPIDLNDYLEYLVEYFGEYFEFCVNLDVIPGLPGKKRSPEEVASSASEGWSNFMLLREAGFSPIPVYHGNEDPSWLQKMLDSGCDIIGLSARKDLDVKGTRFWFDQVFSFIDSKGFSKVKTHCFGMTVPELMADFPWYSVDSASWSLGAGYGLIVVPKKRTPDGGYDFLGPMQMVLISDRGTKDGKLAKGTMNYLLKGEQEQKYIVDFLNYLGFTYEQIMGTPYSRYRQIIRYYKFVVEALNKKRGGSPFPFRLFYVDSPDKRDLQAALHFEGISDRLVSYWYLMGVDRAKLNRYMSTGFSDIDIEIDRRFFDPYGEPTEIELK